MKCFSFTTVIASFSSFRSSTIQVPKNAPPRMQKTWRFSKGNVFLPSYLQKESKLHLETQYASKYQMNPIAYLVQEGLCGFLSTYMQQIFVNIQCQSETIKHSISSVRNSIKS